MVVNDDGPQRCGCNDTGMAQGQFDSKWERNGLHVLVLAAMASLLCLSIAASILDDRSCCASHVLQQNVHDAHNVVSMSSRSARHTSDRVDRRLQRSHSG